MRSPLSWLMALVVLSSLSCKDPVSDSAPVAKDGIYFEFMYSNWAWEYVHSGWFIDTSGTVISYDIAASGDTWNSSASGYYSEEEIWAKIHHNDTVRGYIPRDTVRHLRTLALDALSSTNSDTVSVGADMGSASYRFYVYSADSSKFQCVVLQLEGDWQFHNTSPSAIELVTWMSQIHQHVVSRMAKRLSMPQRPSRIGVK